MSETIDTQISEILELQEKLANFRGVGHGAGAARNNLSEELKEKIEALETTLVASSPEVLAQYQQQLQQINFDEETKAAIANGTLAQVRNQETIQGLLDEIATAQANITNANDVRAMPHLQSQLAEKITALEAALPGVDDQTLLAMRERLEALPLSENGQEMLTGRYDNISLATARERSIASETANMPQLEVADANVQNVSSTTSSSLSALEGKTLFKGVGNYDNSVTILQQTLQALEYDLGQFGVDGHYGTATEAAVKAFQAAHGLPQDGIVGEDTFKALQQELAKRQAQTVATDTPVIPQGQTTTVVESPNPAAIDPVLLGIPENQLTMT